MMSSNPTSNPGAYKAISNPYAASSYVNPSSQQPQPVGSINQGNQAQGGQPPLITSPGTFAGSQLGLGNIQMTTPSMGTVATNFTKEAKTLGAIQIVIGLMHIGFGIILGLLSYSDGQLGFASTTFIGGYPFWGGLSFIISGSLSVSATKDFSLCLIKGSLGMNITSCIFALLGVITLLVDLSINGILSEQSYWAVLSGVGISAMLLIFSLLEFGIACATAQFAQQIISSTSRAILVVPAPTVYANNPLPPESSSTPPRYNGSPAYVPRY
uniref:Membrane spanning 4-domains A12 n=1 Tax=Prolemur simus TaxID=1328070 RepID=A0A8C9AIC7_PROSS